MIGRLAIAALVTSTAGAVAAQSLPIESEGGRVTFAWNGHNDGSDQPRPENWTTSLTARSNFGWGGGPFGIGASLGLTYERYDDAYFSTRGLVGLHPYYRLNDTDWIGLYIVSETDNDDNRDTLYGVEGMSVFGSLSFSGYIGRTEFENGGEDGNLGLALGYDVTPEINLYGYTRRDFDLDDPGDNYLALSGIGASYDLSEIGTLPPLTLAAEYARFHSDSQSFGGSDWDQISLVVTYTFNGATPSPLRDLYRSDYFYD